MDRRKEKVKQFKELPEMGEMEYPSNGLRLLARMIARCCMGTMNSGQVEGKNSVSESDTTGEHRSSTEGDEL